MAETPASDTRPLVSVVLPTRDRPRLLSIALECYARQTYPNRELIVVDNGLIAPVDEAAVAAVGGRLLRVDPALKLGSKLNAGIEQARGVFIQKMDDDDFYAPPFVETMVQHVLASWGVVSRPTMAILVGFLFFDVARWEVRRSIPENAPGATLFFTRDFWEEQPFRGVPRDEDVWFYQDRMRLGGVCVPVSAPETFMAVRHRGSPGDRGHTWTQQLNGSTLETYLLDRPLYPGGPEALLPDWALARYRTLRSEILAGAGDDDHRTAVASAQASSAAHEPTATDEPPADTGKSTEAATATPAAALLHALTDPAVLTGADLTRPLRALTPGRGAPKSQAPALTNANAEVDPILTACAGALYARWDLAGSATVARLYTVLDGPPLSPMTERRLGALLGVLAATPAATALTTALRDLLGRPTAGDATHSPRTGALLTAAEQAVRSNADAFDLDWLVRLATGPALAPYRSRVLHGLVAPTLLARPVAATVEHLDLLAGSFGADPAFGLLLAALAEATAAPAEVRAVAAAGLARHLPLRARVGARLRVPGARVLVVHNAADTPLDEIASVPPLLQALLAANPDLEGTLVTARPRLYGHVRLSLVPRDRPERVAAALAERYDVVISVTGNGDPAPRDPAVERLVQAHREQHRPFLFVEAVGGVERLAYRRVEIEGRPYAASLGLDRPQAASTYPPTARLAAHLGLPLHPEQGAGGTSAVLAALPSQTAAFAWADTVDGLETGRPVALVAPFGEDEPHQGFIADTFAALALHLHALVDEGYAVVLLPNAQPWGDETAAHTILDLLAAADRAHVVLAPPSATGGGAGGAGQPVACEGLGDILVSPAECRQRTALAWVQYASLVVGVGGWPVHASALHGKPYRVLPAPHGDGAVGLRESRPRLAALAPVLAPPPAAGASLLATAPLPSGPHRELLLLVLRGLPDLDDVRLLAVVRWALSSPDRDIRLAALTALLQGRARTRGWALAGADVLVAVLSDRWCRVRAAAAEALLAARPAPSHAVAAIGRRTLRAHWLIGRPTRNWDAVLGLGDDATPAVQAALGDDDPDVRREAAQALARHVANQLASPPAPEASAVPGETAAEVDAP